jgi:hypothetical protein
VLKWEANAKTGFRVTKKGLEHLKRIPTSFNEKDDGEKWNPRVKVVFQNSINILNAEVPKFYWRSCQSKTCLTD